MLVCLLACWLLAPPASTLTAQEAQDIAISRSKVLIAARLQIDQAEVERVVAALLPNPHLAYSVGNLVLGRGNPQDQDLRPKIFDQTIQNIELSTPLDVWFKRALRRRVADAGRDLSRLLVEDAIRQIRHAVASAHARIVREQDESELAGQVRERYDKTVALSRKRFVAGDISAAELQKVELETLKYVNLEIDARLELSLARQELALLLAFDDDTQLPAQLQAALRRPCFDAVEDLVAQAQRGRPDVRAAQLEVHRSALAVTSAEREAYPEVSLGVGYTRSRFQISGDNPHALGLNLSVELPLFERNQGGIGEARIAARRADNELAQLHLEVGREVRAATRAGRRAEELLRVFEGGMLEKAQAALDVADKAYRAGATSLLETLEAQRTYIETRAHYLETVYDWHQACIDTTHAVGSNAT